MTPRFKIGVLGLGKLGLPFSLVAARLNIVYGWDIDQAARDIINTRISDDSEPHIDGLLKDRVVVLAKPDIMARECDAVFIVVPTPSKHNGAFNPDYVRAAIESLHPGLAARGSAGGPLHIIIVSTVSPGTCDEIVVPGNAVLVYAPTFIALGSVVHDLEYPNLQLIGADGYPKLVQAIMGTIPMWKETEWRWLTHREAEIAKIAVNSFITMKITFANEIGQICHRQGADADKVLHTVGVDPRIGTKYLTAGAGFGGPCFPRDNRALEHETRDDSLMSHIDRLNTHHAEFIVREAARAWALVTDVNNPVKTFTVLGLAYKEGTPHKIESFGVLLTRLLQRRGFTEIHEGEGAPSLVVLALPMEKSDFRKCFIEGTVVFDLWRAHRYLRHEPIHYVPFGG